MAMTDLVAALVDTQEFYLFFFFCVGFCVLRSDRLQHRVRYGVPRREVGKELLSKRANETSLMKQTIERLKMNFDQGLYNEVLNDWYSIYQGSRTIDTLVMVLQALLALGRPEDTGLVLAKAAAHASQELAGVLHEAIEIVSNPDVDVEETHITVAARDIFDQARGHLGASATESLMFLLAKCNDELRVAELLHRLQTLGAPASASSIATLCHRFLDQGNLDAALNHLQCTMSASQCVQGSSVQQVLILEKFLRCAVHAMNAKAVDRALVLIEDYALEVDELLVNKARKVRVGTVDVSIIAA